jgi:uncharacterized membrane protein YeiH
MQPLLEQFGLTVAAITGLLAARGKQADLFAVIVLVLVTGLGWGTIRDVLLRADHVLDGGHAFLVERGGHCGGDLLPAHRHH